ncbi:phycocyanin alpha phycocyanobilin lyase [Crocosphaera subtropica ATCC 51142]|uniref:Phycocyanin alpha phycocyanobilin lyase n=1 Tax=Crocosphaera subtropica (strain ATCC 51142 / BH68) TaxID=43989 RepID=B1WT82_CROS5|nr:HEAT repeat domain-containing protein [Crocosphaera subtropica]ACB52004.1 phycocyanin alpha phycocyanobilin lyase [Crocosphaera subtropica ATCC 51142]
MVDYSEDNKAMGSSTGQGSADDPAYTIEQALSNLQQTDDPSARYYAAWWIGRFRVNEPTAIEALLTALEDESDRSPDGGYPLRRNAAKALGKLGDVSVVPALIHALNCSDYYVRESSAQSLEMLGDERAIPGLIRLLDGGVEAAQQVEGKPHLSEPYEAILEALGTLQAKNAVSLIEPFVNHFVPKVQFAAARALYQLTENPIYGERLVKALQETTLQVRRSALMDLGAIGYLGAVDAIANTLAENSLKLISLKGILEHHLTQQPIKQELDDDLVHLMNVMDSLL